MSKWFVDAGHGGKDPGAVANGLKEKDLTLFMVQHFIDYVKKTYPSVQLKASRTTDTYIELNKRAEMANQWGANAFISFHVNAGGGTGFESYIHPNAKDRTAEIQEIVHKEVLKVLPKNTVDRGRKRKNLAVLRLTSMPAVLLEVLFIDNEKDVAVLKTSSYLKKVAEAAADGLAKAFGIKKANSSTASPKPTTKPVNPTGPLHRVIVDNKQIGAYSVPENVINAVKQNLGKAKAIRIEKV